MNWPHSSIHRLPTQVLCLLSPVDLANLAQTNRAFRTTLTSDAPSARIWNAASKLHGNGPECPPDVGLVPWVRFVYGPPKCGVSLCSLFCPYGDRANCTYRCVVSPTFTSSTSRSGDAFARSAESRSELYHVSATTVLMLSGLLRLVYSGFVAKRFPDIDTGILELIPHTWSTWRAVFLSIAMSD